jgi:hypothetical protein
VTTKSTTLHELECDSCHKMTVATSAGLDGYPDGWDHIWIGCPPRHQIPIDLCLGCLRVMSVADLLEIYRARQPKPAGPPQMPWQMQQHP